jgi:nitrite reductase (NO-forming)
MKLTSGKMKKIILLAITVFIGLMSSCGSNPDKGANSGGVAVATISMGEAIYKKTCITCHQPNGQGLTNAFPPLAKSDYLANKEKTIMQVIKGGTGELVVNGKTYNSTMTQFQLSDEEVAAVLTYVYDNFGNSGGTVTPDEVKAVRTKM